MLTSPSAVDTKLNWRLQELSTSVPQVNEIERSTGVQKMR